MQEVWKMDNEDKFVVYKWVNLTRDVNKTWSTKFREAVFVGFFLKTQSKMQKVSKKNLELIDYRGWKLKRIALVLYQQRLAGQAVLSQSQSRKNEEKWISKDPNCKMELWEGQ